MSPSHQPFKRGGHTKNLKTDRVLEKTKAVPHGALHSENLSFRIFSFHNSTLSTHSFFHFTVLELCSIVVFHFSTSLLLLILAMRYFL